MRRFVIKRSGTSENLCSNQWSSPNVNPEPATDLNRDHREREDIRFLAKCPPIGQDLRCNPSRTVALLVWNAPYRIQILSDHSDTTICDHCVAGGVHKDVQLVRYQYAVVKRSRMTTYSLEIPVNNIAGVEVIQTFCDIR